MSNVAPMLSLRDFSVSFDTARGPLYAVRNVNIDVADGESLGIVGESGSGKTVLSRGAMGLLPKRAAATVVVADEPRCAQRGPSATTSRQPHAI